MADIFSYPYIGLDNSSRNITICSGPIIINSDNKILLHLSSSTDKYQFIGGRLDSALSLKENALKKAGEVIGATPIIILEDKPLCISGDILRDGKKEKIVLFHFLSRLENEKDIGDAEWKTFEEIQNLSQKNMLSSNNILIASKYFLNK